MKFEDYQIIVTNLSETMSYLSDLETLLMDDAGGKQTEAAIFVRLTQCFIGLVAFRLKEDFKNLTD